MQPNNLLDLRVDSFAWRKGKFLYTHGTLPLMLPLHHWSLFLVLVAGSSAGLLMGHGAYHDVVAQLRVEIASHPESAEPRFRLACAHQQHGEWAAALTELELVDRLAPGQHPTGWVRGQALATAGHWQAAKGELDAFLARFPRHEGALAQRGRVLFHLGAHVEALKDYQAALEFSAQPSPELCLEAVAAAQQLHGVRFAAEMLSQLLQRSERADPGLWERALQLDLESGRLAQALLRVEQLQAIAPRPEPWMAKRAVILHQAGRVREAQQAWQALHEHLNRLPSLERGMPLLLPLMAQSRAALGLPTPAVVAAPPAP